jgi:hypothetical protein
MPAPRDKGAGLLAVHDDHRVGEQARVEGAKVDGLAVHDDDRPPS